MGSDIREFDGNYNGIDPDGEHWIDANNMARLLTGNAVHMIVLMDDGSKKTVTLKYGPGVSEHRLDNLRDVLE